MVEPKLNESDLFLHLPLCCAMVHTYCFDLAGPSSFPFSTVAIFITPLSSSLCCSSEWHRDQGRGNASRCIAGPAACPWHVPGVKGGKLPASRRWQKMPLIEIFRSSTPYSGIEIRTSSRVQTCQVGTVVPRKRVACKVPAVTPLASYILVIANRFRRA